MSSFHEVQEQLLLSYEDGILDEDEFLLLHEQFMPKNPNFSHEEYDRSSLDKMNDAECLAEFRFRKNDCKFSQRFFKYLIASDAIKEVLLTEWKVSAFFLAN